MLRSAKRAPGNVRRLNNRKWRRRYCLVGECSRALALLNAAQLSFVERAVLSEVNPYKNGWNTADMATNTNQLIKKSINVPPPSDSPPSSIHRCRSARRPSESRSIVLVGYDIPSPALKADNNHITCLYHVCHAVYWYIARGMLFIYVIFWYRIHFVITFRMKCWLIYTFI